MWGVRVVRPNFSIFDPIKGSLIIQEVNQSEESMGLWRWSITLTDWTHLVSFSLPSLSEKVEPRSRWSSNLAKDYPSRDACNPIPLRSKQLWGFKSAPQCWINLILNPLARITTPQLFFSPVRFTEKTWDQVLTVMSEVENLNPLCGGIHQRASLALSHLS